VTDAPIRISRLLATGRPPEWPVAVDDGRLMTWAGFLGHVGGLSCTLSAHGAGRWVIFTEDTYAFAVALVATWYAGSVAVLAPNGQPGTLAELSRRARGIISDRSIPGLPHVDPTRQVRPGIPSWQSVDRPTSVLELLTSGSTGPAKPVTKTLSNLEDEVAELERRWGGLLARCEIFGTVSHQHIYGLLFRVLWPLSVGRPFRVTALAHADEMASRMVRAGACVLISSPTHLRRLTAARRAREVVRHCRTIFSSGGPLDGDVAAALRDLGVTPIEVFGSTETGGVAWRQQDGTGHSLAWTLFDSVKAHGDAETGRLQVRSPFVHDEGGTFTMADRVEFLNDGRFRLGVRDDRTVKVGDKRLSLPEMEMTLRTHAYVAEAALIVLDLGRGPRVAAAVVPTTAGRTALARLGHRETSQGLVRLLTPYWDRVLLPRVWRYVNRLPEDAQGKVTVASLRALFDSPFDPAVTAPELVTESIGERRREQTLRVPATLGCLDGHFADFPVVPGVTQLQWVADVGRAIAGADLTIERVEGLKFKDLLRPGEVFHLSAELSDGHDRLTFRLWNERRVFSSGRCIVTARPAEAS
jgi:acyl-coenzyme A synthetase/AMP-(fatty) acid ligase/3-hydroxymyristoyl/3-hydroxydecanoyl-(acyl carrier protein) dehydratase